MAAGYMQSLLPLLNKKFLTPMDIRRIRELLLRMRMTCDATYLIDRHTHISPKLKELEGIIEELVVESGRKMVIFSEWTTMTFLIARHLSDAGINFVELCGKVPVKRHRPLIDEFSSNPYCRGFKQALTAGRLARQFDHAVHRCQRRDADLPGHLHLAGHGFQAGGDV
jgi:SNF2 family DNA or RNA helicase